MLTYELWPLSCDWSGCDKPPTVVMKISSAGFGVMLWNYCEGCVERHKAIIAEVNEKQARNEKLTQDGAAAF